VRFPLARVSLAALSIAVSAGACRAQGEHVRLLASAPATVKDGTSFTLELTLRIAPGFHIQSNEPAQNYIATGVKVTGPAGLEFGRPKFPPATMEQAAGETIPVFGGDANVTVPVTVRKGVSGRQALRAAVSYQACDEGSCYPPSEVFSDVSVTVGAGGKAGAGHAVEKPAKPSPSDPKSVEPEPADGADPAATTGAPTGGHAEAPSGAQPDAGSFPGYRIDKIAEFVGPEEFVGFLQTGKRAGQDVGAVGRLLDAGNLLVALPLIFLLGLALNLTPCVYPIIPITISYFGAQARTDGPKPAVLAVFYVLGMALMYSALGVAAGLTGDLFGAQLQNPWVLLTFALVMFGLALSQFDRPDGRPIWEFQLPGFLRNRAQSRSGVLGAVMMGLMVGVVAAPCIGPAVIALLQWVGTQRDPVLGFAVFFTLALGLGAPYIILATVSGSVKAMPRAGEWMVGVKHIFGAVLIWMGVYYLQTPLALINQAAPRALLVTTSAMIALYLLFVDRSGANLRAFVWLRRSLGIVAAALTVWLLSPAPPERIRWQPYTDEALSQAMLERRPIGVDFTADWCAACKELEHKTFSDAAVGRAAGRFTALRADMTNFGGAQGKQWQRRYGIKGLPTVVRLEPQ